MAPSPPTPTKPDHLGQRDKPFWDVYMCKTCRYTFRSTEPDYMTDPKKYDPTFKLDPKKLDDFPMMPAIPPLRNK
jgi:hypothetical protein